VDTAASAHTVDLTATELRLMTPEYASPEQVRGAPVGPPSDVYSLGVALYELLTGRHPHPTTTRLRMDLERAICEQDPPAPSTAVGRPPTGGKGHDSSAGSAEELSRRRGRTARALRRELAGDVDTIVLKALRKEPERRYATAGELADDLGRMLAGLPVQARPDTWRYRAGKLARRNKGLVISILAVLVVLLVASVVSTTLFVRAEKARRESVEREYVARMASAVAALESLDVNRARRDLELAPESERGWEWRHLMARLDRSDETLTDLGRRVILRSVAFDRDGRWMAVSGEHGRVHLFDRADGSEVATRSLPGVLKGLTFLGGGAGLAVVREGGAVHLLGVPSLDVRASRSPEAAVYWGLASPASREWLACTRSDGRVDILDPVTLEVRRSLDVQPDAENLAVSPDGAMLACGGSGRDVALWDAVTGEPVVDALRVGGVVNSLAFSPDGSLLAVTLATESRVGTLMLVDAASGEVLEQAAAHLEAIRKVLFHPDDDRMATGSLDGTIRVWSVPGLEPLQVLLGHGSAISDLARDPITGRMASVDADGRTKAWEWGADAVRHWTGDSGWNMGLDVSPDSRRVVLLGQARTEEGQRATIAVHEVATRAEVWSAVLEQAGESSASFSPDGSRIAVATLDGLIEIRDAATGEVLLAAPAGGGGSPAGGKVRNMVWSPDGRSVISAGPGSSGWIHDAATLEPLTRLDSHHRSIWTVGVDPLGERILTGGSGSPVVDVWSAGTGLLLDSLEGHTDGALCSAFHPAGEVAATGSADNTVRLWRVADATPLALLEGHTARVIDLDFSPDGSRLASCSYDRTVRLWSIPDGREVATLRGHRGFVRHVRFAPDGSFLASIATDGEVRIWDVPPVEAPD
jgi:WD40 repeat protein